MNEIIEISGDIDHSVNVGRVQLEDIPERCKKHIHTSTFKVVVQNIRSINHNFDDFLIFLNRLDINEDIVILTECWLPKCNNLPSLGDYDSYKTTQYINQSDGVVAYVKNSVSVRVYEPQNVAEMSCLVIIAQEETAFVCIYRSPSIIKTDTFLDSLNRVLSDLKHYKQIVMVGDINIDIKLGNKDNRSSDYLDLLGIHGLLPSHNLPTHDNNCLDHSCVRLISTVDTIICTSTVADHSCIILSFNKNIDRGNPKQKKLKKIDYKAIVAELQQINWKELLSNLTSNDATERFITTIREKMKNHTSTIIVQSKTRSLKPWVTPGLIRCIRNRDRLYKRMKKDPSNVIIKISYLRYRNTCNKILKNLKNLYFQKEMQRHKYNVKKQWGCIKKLCYLEKNKVNCQELLNCKPNTEDSLNYINNYFINVGNKLANEILAKNNLNEHDLAKTTTDEQHPISSFVLLPTDEAEVRSTILSLKNSSATGWDDLPSKLYKSGVDALCAPITAICNSCFNEGVFPDALKRSVVIPIFKTGERDDIANYRPISLLPTLSKIIEKLINKRLKNYLESNNLLSENQYGFRDQKSTTDAIQRVISKIVSNLDSNRKALAIFLDLAKAFDTVSIPILLKKLENIGIRGKQLDLFTHYLKNRRQSVLIGEHRSAEECVSFGVPQGSILGPTLFLIYINQMCNTRLRDAEIITFADDTVLVFTGDNWEDVNQKATEGFGVINNWLKNNLLTLNIGKTKHMIFTIRGNTQPTHDAINIQAHNCGGNLPCNCPQIIRTSSIKYLGLLVDNNLNWKEHVSALAGRVRKLMFIFKTLRNICDKQQLISVYYALCQSVISYGITCWGGCPKSTLLKLERAQRGILKLMTFKQFRYPTTLLYKNVGVLTVRQLFIKLLLIKQHKEPRNRPIRKRRKDLIFKIPTCKTSFAHSFSQSLGPRLYNRVSRTLTDLYLQPLYTCKKSINSYLKQLNYEDTELLLK